MGEGLWVQSDQPLVIFKNQRVYIREREGEHGESLVTSNASAGAPAAVAFLNLGGLTQTTSRADTRIVGLITDGRMKFSQSAPLPPIHSVLWKLIACKSAESSQAGVCALAVLTDPAEGQARAALASPAAAPRPTHPSLRCRLLAYTPQAEPLWESPGTRKWQLSLAAGPGVDAPALPRAPGKTPPPQNFSRQTVDVRSDDFPKLRTQESRRQSPGRSEQARGPTR